MITATNIVELLAGYRCFKYYSEYYETWTVYETLPEEGEGVKKMLGRFETEEEADEFLEAYTQKLKEHIASVIVVVQSTEVPLPVPLVKDVRKGKAPKRSRKKKDESTKHRHRDNRSESEDSRGDGVRSDPIRYERPQFRSDQL